MEDIEEKLEVLELIFQVYDYKLYFSARKGIAQHWEKAIDDASVWNMKPLLNYFGLPKYLFGFVIFQATTFCEYKATLGRVCASLVLLNFCKK